VPLVVTFHDIAVLRHPDAFNRWTRSYSSFALPKVARAAAALVTGSAFTRDELVDALGVPEAKVHVTPYGVGAPFTPEGPASAGEFVLAVATLEPRKNLTRLVEGFRRARLDGCELRVVGARGWGDVSVDGRDVRWLGEVDDEELARLYRGARCLAYVSLYEGFGLPVLEAMACGTPVVTSTAPPFREFADGASVAVDPFDPDAIAAGLVEAINRGGELGTNGRMRAGALTWKATAAQTLAVYREVAC
jgi:glycosyltransferase involved in cell wall biosynthesis